MPHTHRHAVVLTYPHTQPYNNPLGSGPLWRWRDDAWHRTQAQERNLRGHEKLGPRHRGKDHQTRKGASTTRTPPSGRRDELILKEELLAMLPMRPERSQMISAPYPGRLPGEGGGLLLSQQLGHLVLFLQRMPSETSSLAFRRRTGRCDCSAPRSTRCAPGISRGHGGCRTKGVSTDRRRHLLEIHPNGVCQQDYWVVCEIRHVHAES